MKRHLLKNLVIRRIALVRAPAHEGATVALVKSKETNVMDTTTTTPQQALNAAIRGADDAAARALDALVLREREISRRPDAEVRAEILRSPAAARIYGMAEEAKVRARFAARGIPYPG